MLGASGRLIVDMVAATRECFEVEQGRGGWPVLQVRSAVSMPDSATANSHSDPHGSPDAPEDSDVDSDADVDDAAGMADWDGSESDVDYASSAVDDSDSETAEESP